MNPRFTSTVSIVFGVFALLSAALAVSVAVRHSGTVWADLLRFGFILITAGIGLALLRPHRVLPVLRRAARRVGSGPVRFALALVMFIPALVAMLSGAFPPWITYAGLILYFAAFVLPGTAFRGTPFIPINALGLQDIHELAYPMKRTRPILRSTHFGAFALFVLALVVFFLVPQTITSAAWRPVAGWVALLAAVASVVAFSLPYFMAIPIDFRVQAMPALVLQTAFFLLITAYLYWIVLLNALPAVLARTSGDDVERGYLIVEVEPNRRRKGCHGPMQFQTPAGRQEICNLPKEFLEKISPGDILLVSGKATILGQTIEGVRVKFAKRTGS